MLYCPEIAILHGAFACIEAESKAGKYNLHHHTKGNKCSRQYQFIRDVIHEIINGPESPRSQQDRKTWRRCLHHLLFCKTFVFNKQFAAKDLDGGKRDKALSSYKCLCAPMPDFHPYFFFELSDEFEWSEFLGEMLGKTELATALNFTAHSLMFCKPEPSLLSDLPLMATTLDCLLSVILSQIMASSHENSDSVNLPNDQETEMDLKPRNQHVFAKTEKTETALKYRRKCIFEDKFSISKQKYEEWNQECLLAAEQKKRPNTGADEGVGGPKTHEFPEKSKEETIENRNKFDCKYKEETINEADGKTKTPTVRNDRLSLDIIETADEMMLEKLLEHVNHTVHDTVLQCMDFITELLVLVQKRMSTKLFDRSSCKSGAMAKVLPVLGHILGSVLVLSVLSNTNLNSQELGRCLQNWVAQDEDKETDSLSDTVNSNTSLNTPHLDDHDSVDIITEAFARLSRTSQLRSTCRKCLSSFFAVQASKESQKLSAEKAVKFGRVLTLNQNFCKLPKSLKSVHIVKTLSEQLIDGVSQKGEGGADELKTCVSVIVRELEKREKVAEHKRLNPSLADVIEEVEKKLPRWEWCVQYGLAKRHLKEWWLAGFLELLWKKPGVLTKESDVRHLVAVLQQMSLTALVGHRDKHQNLCAELIVKTYSQLSEEEQGRLLVDMYMDPELSNLMLMSDFDRSLTVTFNKLSTSSLSKCEQDILRLALHDVGQFTQHAVSTAITNHGQIAVVIKVLQGMPEVMRSHHPLHHPGRSLLCHCLHSTLQNHPLDKTEQKNCLHLVSLLVKPFNKDATHHTPLLSPSEFLSTSSLPFITLQSSNPLIPSDFALRLLIGCLETTLSDGFSDWLEEVQPVVILACCAGVLQACVETQGFDSLDVDWMVGVKTLVLGVVDELLKHFTARGKGLDERSVCWLQKRCTTYDWSVCVYLSPFLSIEGMPGINQLVSDYVTEAVKIASDNLVVLLRLSSISDAAETLVRDRVERLQEDVQVSQFALIHALVQLLPGLLVTEMARVVRVVSVLVTVGVVDANLRQHSFLADSGTDFSGCETDLKVSELLTDALVVVVSLHPPLSTNELLHVAQVSVAALQAISQSHNKDSAEQMERSSTLEAGMFYHVCTLMSVCPEVMTDPLFVVLLDLLSSFSMGNNDDDDGSVVDLKDFFLRGMDLIPKESLRETLRKKFESEELSQS